MFRRLIMLPFILLVVACSNTVSAPEDASIVKESYTVADDLIRILPRNSETLGSVLYTSAVDIEDIKTTSRFGKMMSEHVASRFSQHGYEISEARLRDALSVTSEGEFMLSRDLRQIAREHNAWAVIVGTYAPANTTVFVNYRVIDLQTGAVAASVDKELPKGKNTASLIGYGNTSSLLNDDDVRYKGR